LIGEYEHPGSTDIVKLNVHFNLRLDYMYAIRC